MAFLVWNFPILVSADADFSPDVADTTEQFVEDSHLPRRNSPMRYNWYLSA